MDEKPCPHAYAQPVGIYGYIGLAGYVLFLERLHARVVSTEACLRILPFLTGGPRLFRLRRSCSVKPVLSVALFYPA